MSHEDSLIGASMNCSSHRTQSKSLLLAGTALTAALACGGIGEAPPRDVAAAASEPEPSTEQAAPTPVAPPPAPTPPPFDVQDLTEHLSDQDKYADEADWTPLELDEALPGAPRYFDVYEGGGEGDCAIQALQFEVDGAIRSRLFWESYCFGDTSEMSAGPIPMAGTKFTIRAHVDFIDNAEMDENGFFQGDPAQTQIDHIFEWEAKRLVFVERKEERLQ